MSGDVVGLLLELAKDSPWMALTAFLIYRQAVREGKTLEAFRSGIESNRELADAIQGMQRLETRIEDIRADIRDLRKGPG